jgi:hypothetical protein
VTHPDRNNGAATDQPRRPGTFRPGNPGRPPGSRNKATLAALALLEGEAEAITRKAIELAKEGDPTALRLVLDRLLPKGRAVRLDLPLRTLADLDQATEAIRGALAEGSVTPDEVATLTGLVEARRRLLETTELERRLAALEEQQQQQPARAP